MGRKSKDYTGLIFGDLTVIGKTNKKDCKRKTCNLLFC